MTSKKQYWWKQGIKGGSNSCMCCPDTTEILSADTEIYMGFGGWRITKNRLPFYTPNVHDDGKAVSDIEEMIGEDDENEYLAVLELPLRDATYQRHSKNNWVLIKKGQGFA